MKDNYAYRKSYLIERREQGFVYEYERRFFKGKPSIIGMGMLHITCVDGPHPPYQQIIENSEKLTKICKK